MQTALAAQVTGAAHTAKRNAGDGAAQGFGQGIGKGSLAGTDESNQKYNRGAGNTQSLAQSEFQDGHILEDSFFDSFHSIMVFVQSGFDESQIDGTFDAFVPRK